MKIIVPEPPKSLGVARLVLDAEGIEYELVKLGRSPYAYGRLYRELWEQGTTFLVVEHDIAPAPGDLQRLWDCECLLGGYDYMRQGNSGHALGCTKFTAELIAQAPAAWKGWGDNAPLLQWDKVHWVNTDGAIFDSLAGYGFFLNESVDEHPYTFHTHGAVAHARREP